MIHEYLHSGRIDLAFDNLMERAAAFPGYGYADRIGELQNAFQYMGDFMMKGYQDATRHSMYASLKEKLLVVDYNLSVLESIGKNAYVAPQMKRLANMDTSVESLQSHLLKNGIDSASHHQWLTDTFYALLTSDEWNTEEQMEWGRFLVAKEVRLIDRLMIVGAVSLSCMEHYSEAKAMLLAEVYVKSLEEQLRQRAFVGLMCAIAACDETYSYYTQSKHKVMKWLFKTLPSVAKDIVELQMQMQKCANAEKEGEEIHKNIMPDILKNQSFTFNDKGIVEREDDSDGLDLNLMERRMDEMEKSINKVKNMQEKGSDIFFSGFKQMKKFPFFYKLHNWFMPFDETHPDLAKELELLNDSTFLKNVLQFGPFCDSDKYSFVIVFASIVKSLPDNVRKMMEQGEMSPLGMHTDAAELMSPVMLRRQYLQDLYRFYSLNPFNLTSKSPFENIESLTIWKQIVGYSDNDYYVAEYYNRIGEADVALEYYERFLANNPGHKPTMRSMARLYFMRKDYAKAAHYYDALRTLDEKRLAYSLNYCVAMTKWGKGVEVVNELFRLDFEYPGKTDIQNTLAWNQLCVGKAEKALQIYERMEDAIVEDFSVLMNAVYAYMIAGRMNDAMEIIRKFKAKYKQEEGNTKSLQDMIMESMTDDATLLEQYNIGEAERTIFVTRI